MKRFIALALFATLSVASCTHKDDMDQAQSGKVKRFTARFSQSVPAVKVAADYDADVVKVLWEQEDMVGVFAGDGTPEKFLSMQSGKETTLQGPAVSDALRYYAMYPYAESAVISSGVISTYLPSEQYAAKDKIASHLAVASTIGSSLNFSNVCTLVRVYVACNGLTKIEFTGKNGEIVAGDISIDAENATYTLGESGSEVVTLFPPVGTGSFDVGTYYFSILPQRFANGIMVSAYRDEDVYCSFSVNYSVTLRSGEFIGPDPFVDVDTGQALGEGGISVPEQLLSFAKAVNEGGDISSYCNAEGNVVLLDDIRLTDTPWTPIGNAAGLAYDATEEPQTAFTGVFDGQDHTISGLRLDVSSGNVTSSGFFGALNGATVRNVKFDDVKMNFNSSEISPSHLAIGTVAAYVYNSTIQNVTVAAEYSGVATSSSERNVSVGGIAGFVSGSQSDGSYIMDCEFNGTMTNDIGTMYKNYNSASVGGIVGHISNDDNLLAKVTHCTNNADIQVKAHRVAGIVASGMGQNIQIENCVNNGHITASYSANWTPGYFDDGRPIVGVRLGGILGYRIRTSASDSYVRNCTNTGTLSTTEPASATGGIAGLVRGMQLIGCRNSGNIYSSGTGVDYPAAENLEAGTMIDGRGLMIGRIKSGQPIVFSNCYVCGKVGEHAGNAIVVTVHDYLDYCYVLDEVTEDIAISDVANIGQNIKYWDWSYELELDHMVNDSGDEIEW